MNIWWDSCIFIDRFKPPWRGSQVSRRYKYEPYTSLYIYYIQGWFTTPITIGFMLGISIVTMANIFLNKHHFFGHHCAHFQSSLKHLQKILWKDFNEMIDKIPLIIINLWDKHHQNPWKSHWLLSRHDFLALFPRTFELFGPSKNLVRPLRYSVAAVADGEEEVMKRLALAPELNGAGEDLIFFRKMWENSLAIMNVRENWSIKYP